MFWNAISNILDTHNLIEQTDKNGLAKWLITFTFVRIILHMFVHYTPMITFYYYNLTAKQNIFFWD